MLNKEQKRAVSETEGRVLILAGAGSGKTSVLTHRIAHLIKTGRAGPENILGLTFTNKAAGEMKERVAALVGKDVAKKVTLCTFHSFCMRVLRQEIERLGYTKNFSLYDERDIKRLVTELAKEELEHEGKLPSLEPTMDVLREAKMHGKAPDKGDQWHDQFATKLYGKLEGAMRAYNAVDFDSLLTLTVKLFLDFPDVLARYQERFRYIMIDEYQDTNPIQYRLADLMAMKHNNLCVVGDDDQSIYGWRGACVRHILQFKADTTVKLEQNYRSSPSILEAANKVISHNKERHDKQLWSRKADTGPIEVFHAPTEMDEAQAIVDRIVQLKEERGLKWSDFAILYRSNALARPVESALVKTPWKNKDRFVRGIPYAVFGGTEMFARSEVKDLMSYLRVIANGKDQEAILRIINFPRRGISDSTVDKLTTYNRREGLSLFDVIDRAVAGEVDLGITPRGIEGLKKFKALIAKGRDAFDAMPLDKALQSFIEMSEIKKAVTDEVKSEKMKKFKEENIDECVHLISDQENLTEFLSESLLNQNKEQHKKRKGGGDHVSLMTFHSAKGLEFPICFLMGCEDHLIPHEKSLMETGLEEERRLLYVAITRAKEKLFISMARQRSRMGKVSSSQPSRFLFEIPKELLAVTSWRR